MTRDYLSVKVWDLNMESRPVETHQVRPRAGRAAQLRTALPDVAVVSSRCTSICEASFVLCTKTTASSTSSRAAGTVRTGGARRGGAAWGAAGLCRPGHLPAERRVQGRDRASEQLSPHSRPRPYSVHGVLQFLLAVFKMLKILFKYFKIIFIVLFPR